MAYPAGIGSEARDYLKIVAAAAAQVAATEEVVDGEGEEAHTSIFIMSYAEGPISPCHAFSCLWPALSREN